MARLLIATNSHPSANFVLKKVQDVFLTPSRLGKTRAIAWDILINGQEPRQFVMEMVRLVTEDEVPAARSKLRVSSRMDVAGLGFEKSRLYHVSHVIPQLGGGVFEDSPKRNNVQGDEHR